MSDESEYLAAEAAYLQAQDAAREEYAALRRELAEARAEVERKRGEVEALRVQISAAETVTEMQATALSEARKESAGLREAALALLSDSSMTVEIPDEPEVIEHPATDDEAAARKCSPVCAVCVASPCAPDCPAGLLRSLAASPRETAPAAAPAMPPECPGAFHAYAPRDSSGVAHCSVCGFGFVADGHSLTPRHYRAPSPSPTAPTGEEG